MNTDYPLFIHPSAVVDTGSSLGRGCKVWHFSHVMGGAVIGDNCILGQNVFIGQGVMVGDDCKIQNNVSIYAGVTLEGGVFIGPSVVFTNVFNPRARVERKDEYRKTLIKEGATIGANATVVCGVVLGEYCMVGAGSVITRDVPPYSLVYGIPARLHGWVSQCGEPLLFNYIDSEISEQTTCKRCGATYYLYNKRIIRRVEK